VGVSDQNREVIRRLYEAMDAHDGDAMAACYAPDASFEDPVFGQLSGAEAGNMWRMLTSRSKDLRVELAEHEAEGERGSARWIARYTFTPTGRRVTNDIRASFHFRDGLIVEHVDRFSFYRWARQALGPMGILLGWAPPLRLALRRRALEDLERFSRKGTGRAAEPPKPDEGAP
jgi:ketosteroid isomerase-like protein